MSTFKNHLMNAFHTTVNSKLGIVIVESVNYAHSEFSANNPDRAEYAREWLEGLDWGAYPEHVEIGDDENSYELMWSDFVKGELAHLVVHGEEWKDHEFVEEDWAEAEEADDEAEYADSECVEVVYASDEEEAEAFDKFYAEYLERKSRDNSLDKDAPDFDMWIEDASEKQKAEYKKSKKFALTAQGVELFAPDMATGFETSISEILAAFGSAVESAITIDRDGTVWYTKDSDDDVQKLCVIGKLV